MGWHSDDEGAEEEAFVTAEVEAAARARRAALAKERAVAVAREEREMTENREASRWARRSVGDSEVGVGECNLRF